MCFPSDIREAIVLVGKLLDQKGFVAGTDGNISVRLEDDRVLITPAGAAKGRLTPESLVMLDLTGNVVGGQGVPSTETAMHLFAYRRRPDIRACVHSHAPFTTAFAAAGKPLAGDVLPELVLAVGTVPLTDYYAPTGTEAVPESLVPYLEHSNAFILRNHGLLTIGRTLEEAYNRHETVEHYAKILHLAFQLGDINTLPQEEFERLAAIRLRNS